MIDKRKVFVSYSRKDSKWLDRLEIFLRPLERDAELQLWRDTDIPPGSNWQKDIETALEDADAAILLISPDFLASDYIASNELPQLLSAASERGLKIFPVSVSTSFLRDSPLGKFQFVNNPSSSPLDSLPESEQNKILTKLIESIDDLLKVARAGVTEDWLERFRSRFIPIEGGTCIIGDDELYKKQRGLQEQEVKINSFRLGKYVVTQSEWTTIMRTQPWLNQKNVKYGSDIPTVYVNWYEANDFVKKINRVDTKCIYRLPSEAEWEYTARGGQKVTSKAHTKFSFGNDANQMMQYGWYDQNASMRGNNYAHTIGELSPNQLGLYDMHGNIWEWTADNVDGLRPSRGGAFNYQAEGACSAFRIVQKPEMKGEAIGFRLVQEQRF